TEHIRFTLMGRPIASPDELRRIAELRRVFQAENFEPYMSYLREALERIHVDINTLSDDKLDSIMQDNELEPRNLNDRSLLFLNKHPELQFLLASTSSVKLDEDIELDEEIIKKLKNLNVLLFRGKFRPSDS